MLIDVYKDPELYEAIYKNKNDDFPFYAHWAKKSGPNVLELACGTGRLAAPLIQAGYNYTGLDISPEFINWCRARFNNNSTFVMGDMRNFDLNQKYNLIFIGFNAFLHLETEKQALECLHSVQKHLAPQGRFLLDIFVPQAEFLYREKRRYRVKFINHPRNGKCTIFEKNFYDDQTEINHIQWFFEEEQGEKIEQYNFNMRMYFPDTMDRILHDSEYFIEEKWGNYNGLPIDSNSHLQLYVCTV